MPTAAPRAMQVSLALSSLPVVATVAMMMELVLEIMVVPVGGVSQLALLVQVSAPLGIVVGLALGRHQTMAAVVAAVRALLVAQDRGLLAALVGRERLTLLRVPLSPTLAVVVAVRLAELLVQAALVAGLTVLTAAPFQRQQQPISAVVAGDAVQVVAALVPVDPAVLVLSSSARSSAVALLV